MNVDHWFGDRSLEYEISDVLGERGAALEEVMCAAVGQWHDELQDYLADGMADEDERALFEKRLESARRFIDEISELRGRPRAKAREQFDAWVEGMVAQASPQHEPLQEVRAEESE